MRACIRYFRRHHVGFLALFIALGGTAYAASLPRNSVGTNQLKRNAVTSVKVRNSSLRARDFAPGALMKGNPGPRGVPGPQGPKGDAGPPAVTSVTVRKSVAIDEQRGNAAFCGPGEVATGGGGEVFPAHDTAAIVSSRPFPQGNGETATGWRVGAVDPEGMAFVTVWVVCARLA